MPKSPDSEGVPRLMTVTEIAEEHGVTRQTVHSYRKRGVFPKPVEGEGSTRPRFRADEVAAFFAANPKQPGKRTDLTDQQQGEPMAHAVDLPGWRVTPEQLDLFVRALVNEVDYDIHKGYECGEEDGKDHYPELVAEAAKMLDEITGVNPGPQDG